MRRAPPEPEARPARRFPSERLQLEIYARQNGRCHLSGRRLPSIHHCEWHHIPGLACRPIRPDGRDYEPAQLDPDYLFAVHPDSHDEATNGPRVGKKHLLRKDHDKAKATRTRELRDSHRLHLQALSEKMPGKKRERSGKWGKRPFRRR